MPKRERPVLREPPRAKRAAKSSVTPTRPGSQSDSGSVDQRLARLLDSPHLATIVPHLAPETLHAVIRHRGLEACGELATSATPRQLRAVLDIDLWRRPSSGRQDQFDEDRFGEWLEVLIETGEAVAARTIAALDVDIVTTGLARYVRVLDAAALSPPVSDEELPDLDVTPFSGLSCDLGGYVVRAKRTDAWDAIVALLSELRGHHPACFQALMEGCRRLSNSTPEIDGLDELLMAPEQLLYDIAAERDHRRSGQGYATTADARAFLELARQPLHKRAGPAINPLSAAYFRAADEALESVDAAERYDGQVERSTDAGESESAEALVALLADAGLLASPPRALLEGAASQPSRLSRILPLMERVRDADDAAFAMRGRELGFLANTLMAGCSVQSRAFTAQEASDAAVAVCNLGLEHWPARWPAGAVIGAAAIADPLAPLPDLFLVHHDLVTAFEVGWAVLHELTIFVAEHVVEAATALRSVDADVQAGLRGLRRELARECANGTPWRARGALEVVAMIDITAWTSLLGLIDECPVVPAALTAILERRTRAVSATAFEFIASSAQIREVQSFARQLTDVFLR